jgi:hypothetical protein
VSPLSGKAAVMLSREKHRFNPLPMMGRGFPAHARKPVSGPEISSVRSYVPIGHLADGSVPDIVMVFTFSRP